MPRLNGISNGIILFYAFRIMPCENCRCKCLIDFETVLGFFVLKAYTVHYSIYRIEHAANKLAFKNAISLS